MGMLGYNEKENVLGYVSVINYATDIVKLLSGEDEYEYDLADVQLFKKIGEINGAFLYEKDIIVVEGVNYVISSLGEDDNIHLYELNNDLEFGVKVVNNFQNILSKDIQIVDNYYLAKKLHEIEKQNKIEEQQEVEKENNILDFNIKVVKRITHSGFKYYYACHNKKGKMVDLINVIFIGHHLIPEDKYEPIFLNYEDFISQVQNKVITDVSNSEFQNFATGVTFNYSSMRQGESDRYEEDEDEKVYCSVNCDCTSDCEADEDREDDDNEYCDDCYELHEECRCD